MTKRDHEGDLATLLRESVREAGQALGLGPHVCEDLACGAEDRFRLRAAGTVGYVGVEDRKKRDSAIRAKWNGSNERELGREFKLSPRRIQQIVLK